VDRIAHLDPELFAALRGELTRINNTIELIASENFVPPVIMEAQGSILTNKYAEGYPGRRYHGGCEYVDVVEALAIDRAKQLFNAEYANVQPHSGVNANLAVMQAVLEPGDRILGLDLRHGGHLSHGARVSITGRIYKAGSYGVLRETERIDYDQVEQVAREFRPKLLITGGSAYPRFIDFQRFRGIADGVGAFLLVDMAHIAGLVAGGVHPSPVPWADFVSSTTTKTLRGARGGFILAKQEYGPALDKAIFPGIQGGPIMQNVAGKALCFKIAMGDEFKGYARRVVESAGVMAQVLSDAGIRLVTGGTDNHLILADTKSVGLTGRQAEAALEEVGLTVNKNLIPYDTETPMETSGIRVGTAAAAARGFTAGDLRTVAEVMVGVLRAPNSEAVIARGRATVAELCRRYPLYLDAAECGLLGR
jgi:glycine hydroxymethyltransferase